MTVDERLKAFFGELGPKLEPFKGSMHKHLREAGAIVDALAKSYPDLIVRHKSFDFDTQIGVMARIEGGTRHAERYGSDDPWPPPPDDED